MKRYEGRVVVITGASSGIGKALARVLHDRGARLALVDIREPALEQVRRELGGAHTTHVANVADRERMQALPQEIIASHGQIDAIINNAGVTVEGTFAEQSLEDWDHVMGVNFYGVLYGCHFFLPHLMESDVGHIVNISSLFGIIGVEGQSSYCTSKYAVRGLSETLWEELSNTPVDLTVVHPGGIRTNIVKHAKTYNMEAHKRIERFFETKTLPAEKAAELIVSAMEANQRRLLITREAYLGDWIKRLAPAWGNEWLAKFARSSGLMKKKKSRKGRKTAS